MIETEDAIDIGSDLLWSLLDRAMELQPDQVLPYQSYNEDYAGHIVGDEKPFVIPCLNQVNAIVAQFVQESIARNADKLAVSIGFNRSGSEGQRYCAIECRDSGRFYAATHKEMAIGLLSAWVQYLEGDRA